MMMMMMMMMFLMDDGWWWVMDDEWWMMYSISFHYLGEAVGTPLNACFLRQIGEIGEIYAWEHAAFLAATGVGVCVQENLPERLSGQIPTCFFFAFEPTGFQKTPTFLFSFTGSSWRFWPFPKMARKLFGSLFRSRNLRATQLLTSLDIVLFEVPAGTPTKSNID